MTKFRAVPLLSAREKMPFELTPIYLNLKYETDADARRAGDSSGETDANADTTAAP